jgi:hypothetical protein
MRLISRLLLIVALVIATVGVMTAPSQAAEGEWVLQCGFVKSLPDDPIVHPGMPGMAHLHTSSATSPSTPSRPMSR